MLVNSINFGSKYPANNKPYKNVYDNNSKINNNLNLPCSTPYSWVPLGINQYSQINFTGPIRTKDVKKTEDNLTKFIEESSKGNNANAKTLHSTYKAMSGKEKRQLKDHFENQSKEQELSDLFDKLGL